MSHHKSDNISQEDKRKNLNYGAFMSNWEVSMVFAPNYTQTGSFPLRKWEVSESSQKWATGVLVKVKECTRSEHQQGVNYDTPSLHFSKTAFPFIATVMVTARYVNSWARNVLKCSVEINCTS